MAALRTALVELGATDLDAREGEIAFRIPVTARRPQSSVDAGRCTVESQADGHSLVRVELSFRRTAALLALGVVGWLGGIGWFVLGVTRPTDLLAFLTVGFVWLHGIGYGVAGWWFKRELEIG